MQLAASCPLTWSDGFKECDWVCEQIVTTSAPANVLATCKYEDDDRTGETQPAKDRGADRQRIHRGVSSIRRTASRTTSDKLNWRWTAMSRSALTWSVVRTTETLALDGRCIAFDNAGEKFGWLQTLLCCLPAQALDEARRYAPRDHDLDADW